MVSNMHIFSTHLTVGEHSRVELTRRDSATQALRSLSLQMHLRNQRSGWSKIKLTRWFKVTLIGGPNCLIAQVFDWYRMEKNNGEKLLQPLSSGIYTTIPKRIAQNCRGFFSFFSCPTRKRRYFLGENGRKKNGGKCVTEFTTQQKQK